MADDVKKNEHPILENLAVLSTPENIQKYFFGTKKNGDPRAVYDIVRDYTKPKKKKKKKKKGSAQPSTYDFYVSARKRKKKHKKKKGKDFWHI